VLLTRSQSDVLDFVCSLLVVSLIGVATYIIADMDAPYRNRIDAAGISYLRTQLKVMTAEHGGTVEEEGDVSGSRASFTSHSGSPTKKRSLSNPASFHLLQRRTNKESTSVASINRKTQLRRQSSKLSIPADEQQKYLELEKDQQQFPDGDVVLPDIAEDDAAAGVSHAKLPGVNPFPSSKEGEGARRHADRLKRDGDGNLEERNGSTI